MEALGLAAMMLAVGSTLVLGACLWVVPRWRARRPLPADVRVRWAAL